MASLLINSIEKKYKEKLSDRSHPVLGKATINIGRINGGDQPSTVPDLCEITLDRRYIPGETKEQVYHELNRIIVDLKKEYTDFRASVESFFMDYGSTLPHDPFCTDIKSKIVFSAQSAMEKNSIKQVKPTAFPAWSDAGIIHHYTDSECIIMGPGDLAVAHSANESIGIEELREAALIYGLTASTYCGF